MCLGVVEVECSGVVNIFLLDGFFVVMVVEVELVVGCCEASPVVFKCWSGMGDFWKRFSMSLDANAFSVDTFLFGMVI